MSNEILFCLKVIISTLIIAALTVPVAKKIAFHVNALDIPDARKVHSRIMPRLGGLGIFLAFLIGYMLFGQMTMQMNSILIGSFIVVLTGIIDDIKPLKPKDKLIGQIFASLVVTLYGGILINDVNAFGYIFTFGYFSYPITIIFLVACMNIINLIDGLDGLSGGISSIFFATIIILSLFMGRTYGLEFILALIMLGSTLGFLVHNFHPAKIFAGDSGALFLGFIIAIISILGFKGTVLTSVFVPLLILAVPILDTLFAIVRRLLKHQHISDADKEHLHHQLLGLNFSHRTTVLIIYVVNILFATASIFYTLHQQVDIIIRRGTYVLLFLLVCWFALKTNIITDKEFGFKKLKVRKKEENKIKK